MRKRDVGGHTRKGEKLESKIVRQMGEFFINRSALILSIIHPSREVRSRRCYWVGISLVGRSELGHPNGIQHKLASPSDGRESMMTKQLSDLLHK